MCNIFHIFHKWSKWQCYLEDTIMVMPYPQDNIRYSKKRQARECIICGISQIRDLKGFQ